MRKQLVCLITLLFCLTTANAQYVTIPDSAFRSQLKIKYPGCFNGAGQMDTTCAAIVNETVMSITSAGFAGTISNDQVYNITGLRYFKNLQFFSMLNGTDTITDWPRKLKSISLGDSGIDSLPNYFPDSLETFECTPNAGSDYAYLDKPLPPFPPTLVKFAVYTTFNLTHLPPLPASLKHLQLSGSQLVSLPALPAGLQYLEIRGRLHNLPALPAGLKHLDCQDNLLDSLPALPNPIDYLNVSGNKFLSQLPSLPGYLQTLNCQSDSSLTRLPALPTGLKELNVAVTNITCLPLLPDNIERLYFSRTITKCLPNINNNIITQYAGNLPALCNVTNNVNACTAYPVIAGYAFYDANSNGVKDAGEFYKANTKIQLSNGNITFTNDSGYYEIGTTTLGSYTVTPSNTFFNVVPATKTFSFNSYDTTVFQNFAYKPTAVVDSMEVSMTQTFSWVAKPGKPFGYWIDARNVGSGNFGPTTIQLTYDINRLTYDSVSNHAFVHSGNKVTLSLPSFPIGGRVPVEVYFTAKTGLTLGDSVKGVVTLSDGTRKVGDSITTVIASSFDPNDKRATPKLSPSQVVAGKYIDYTIRYQNTGTAPAYHVVLTDTLSSQLQANTLEMISTSHQTKTTITGNAISFEMRNIMLPASGANEPKSHGFVRFRIKPKTTVALGDTVKNKAAIYFDYNSPVVTNTALTEIKNESAVPLRLISFKGSRNSDGNIHLYWTTANEVDTKTFVVEQSANSREFAKAGEVSAIGSGNNSYSFNVASPAGSNVYFRLKMLDKDGRFSYSPLVFIRDNNKAGFVLNENPVKNEIVFTSITPSLLNTEGVLLNHIGAVVKRFTIHSSSQAIAVSDLSSGVYYLKTIQGSEKVVINR